MGRFESVEGERMDGRDDRVDRTEDDVEDDVDVDVVATAFHSVLVANMMLRGVVEYQRVDLKGV